MAPPLRRRLKRSKLPNNINLLLILSVCITVISFYVGSPRITALKETTLLVSEQDENVDSGRLDSLGNVKGVPLLTCNSLIYILPITWVQSILSLLSRPPPSLT
eukprot:scaffold77192_cov37-Cyclotella_meneghiniana.AAC.11